MKPTFNTAKCLPQRTLWIDACRGIAIILVLLGHNNPPFVREIYGFHMPLFFILSGYVYKDKHTNLSLKDEIISLLKGYIIPYLIFGCINMILHIIHLKKEVPTILITNEMILTYLQGILTVDADKMPCCYPMWFLPAFAIAMLAFYIIRNLPRKDLRAFVFAVALVATYFYCNKPRLLNMQAVVPGIILLEIGYILEHSDFIRKHIFNIAKNEKKALYELKLLFIIISLCALSYVGIKYNPAVPRVDMSCGVLGNVLFFFIGGISASIMLMLIVILLGTISNMLIKPFAFLGIHTVFFMAFDESTNSWGGTILQHAYGNSYIHQWYTDFGFRLAIMAVYLITWLLILKLIPPLKKITHS